MIWRLWKFPERISDGPLGLRPVRFSDRLFLRSVFDDAEIIRMKSSGRPLSVSPFSLWWWMKRTYPILYCIEHNAKPIGLTGFYNLVPGEAAEMSLVITDRKSRRLGYGRRVFSLIAHSLKKRELVRNIMVTVYAGNVPSISFWRDMGFREIAGQDGAEIVHLSLDVDLCSREGK